jgi:hypothetical protein
MQLKRIAFILPILIGGLYAGVVLNVTTDVEVDDLTIESGDKMILSTGITLTEWKCRDYRRAGNG